MGFGFSMRMSPRLKQSIKMKQAISLPYVNWSLVDAYEEEGDASRFVRKKLEGIEDIPIDERLKRIDEANEVYRFHYVQSENESGKKGRYYKVPLFRDFSVDVGKIKIPITREEYRKANAMLRGAGRMQRIVRAVPYCQIRQSVKQHLEEKACSLDDAVIIGVDRGGRVPTHVMMHALGKGSASFLKVDQAGGWNGSVDGERLEQIIVSGSLKGKYIIFVDSTVDSGRQIEVLKKYFDSPGLKSRAGHLGWVVAGSNENGETLDNHININWGLNPDESFEDDPRLMGVNYDGYRYNKVRAQPSKTSAAIRNALREVPQGIVLDYENLAEVAKF